jgi:Putative DNA-binding domain
VSLANVDFDKISEKHLRDQIEAGVPEGVRVEYKRDNYGRTDADIREFLKDISSFANTSGGYLVIGINEAEGLPISINALSGDRDQELQRLESLARDGIEPRIIGLRMNAVPIEAGGYAITIHIPKSFSPPHRVSARNTNRFYGRNSSGVHEYSVDELRVAFTAGATVFDRVRAFRAERLARIEAGEGIASISGQLGRLVLHLVPLSAFGPGNPIDLDRAYETQHLLRPPGTNSGFSPSINFDGFATFAFRSDERCSGYAQIFRSGIIEAVAMNVATMFEKTVLVIPAVRFDQWVFEVLFGYLSVLQQLNVSPPIVFMLSLQSIRGARLGVSVHTIESRPTIDRHTLELPEIIIEQYGTERDYQRVARPAFDALWNAGGYSVSRNFDASGEWKPNINNPYSGSR